jgi:membrane-associated phospholipid phosphatase
MKTIMIRLACVATFAGLISCADRPTSPATLRNGTTVRANVSRQFPAALASNGWLDVARGLIASHKLAPIAATRVYALLSVAQYGGIVATDATGETASGDADPENGFGAGGRRRFEAERGAVAGASAQLLSFLFPDAAAALEQRVADEATAGPGDVQPFFSSGVADGRAMGDVLIAWATNDRFNDVWTGTIPTGPGLWIPKGPPSGPLLGAVKPYFMSSGDEFRPPAPPAFLSPAFNAALAEVRAISDTRTPEQAALAVQWAMGAGTQTTMGYWDQLAASYIDEQQLDERSAAHIYALMNAAAMDAEIGCWDAKYEYLLIRPPQADKLITLVIPMPNHPSYPSGHSCVSAAAARVLGSFFPEHAAILDAQVEEAGVSRIYAGIHYRFDVEAGQTLGRSVADLALAVDQSSGLLSNLSVRTQ